MGTTGKMATGQGSAASIAEKVKENEQLPSRNAEETAEEYAYRLQVAINASSKYRAAAKASPEELASMRKKAENSREALNLKSDLTQEYSKLQSIEKEMGDLNHKIARAIRKAQVAIAKEEGINYKSTSSATRNQMDKIRPRAMKDSEVVRLDNLNKKLVAQHSVLTQEFKKKYQRYRDLGGAFVRDWYVASTEWDDYD